MPSAKQVQAYKENIRKVVCNLLDLSLVTNLTPDMVIGLFDAGMSYSQLPVEVTDLILEEEFKKHKMPIVYTSTRLATKRTQAHKLDEEIKRLQAQRAALDV